MQSRIESKNLMLLQAAGNLLRGLLQLLYCRRQQLLLAALLVCSGSSGVLIGCAAGRSSDDSSVMGSFTSLRTVHKYSESAREIMLERYGDDHPAASWPVQGSVEYYQLLRNHDGARLAAAASGSRRHLLSTASTPPTSYTFAEGNETEKYAVFFYAFIDIGTPSVEYFLALDTATDLLWVPCECQQCAPLSAPGTGDNRTSKLNAYSPSSSSTSKPVNCSNPLCIDKTTCATSLSQQCPYTQSRPDLLYTGTNSSGLLFEDNLYFIPEQGGARISSPVVFGCGQTQTGDFLNGELAPDGVLGLGTGEISVPSTLSRELGLLDSFSICTNFRGTGRIAFGDKGPITQQTTPFVSNSSQENLVEIATLEVGNQTISVGLNASFDSLLFYTYLPSAVYTPFVNTYRSLITLPELNLTAQYGLDLCYSTSNSSIEIPSVNFIFPNAAVLETDGGAIPLVNENNTFAGFCLGIRNSSLPEIRIGLSSMYEYSFTFNQQDKLLGWIASTCYNDITISAPAPAPAPIFAPVSTPTSSTPPAPTPPSSAPTSPSPPSLSPLLSPSTGPPTAPPPSASVMEFVLPSPIIALSLLGFLLYLSLL